MPATNHKFTLRISTVEEGSGLETLVFETKNNDLKQILELEENLLALFTGILKKQRGDVR